MLQTPVHGGNLDYATQLFGEPAAGWQDLSTGISPWGYPLGDVPEQVWRNLPVLSGQLMATAADYYQSKLENTLAIPGSQYAISQLPQQFEPATVAVPAVGYSEHARCWQRAGHRIKKYKTLGELITWCDAKEIQHAVVINPNNPTGEVTDAAALSALAQHLPGALIVDEAFADFDSQQSLAAYISNQSSLYLLRSLGKFFGLAGARVGFLLGPAKALEEFSATMPPWPISGPSLWVANQALRDSAWQTQQKLRLTELSRQLKQLLLGLTEKGFELVITNAGLFVVLFGDPAVLQRLYKHLGYHGVFTRWGYEQDDGSGNTWLRIGLPDDECRRIKAALESFE